MGNEMLIDRVLPRFDATIIEHIVVDAPPEVVVRTAREMDFLQIHTPLVDALMAARGLPARIGRRFGNRPAPPPPPAMRLADLFDAPGSADALEGWVGLGEEPGRELVFGAVGKFWQASIDWRTVTAEAFPTFDEPDHAKIAAGFSVREYGSHRTLLSYEARTAATDPAARRKFVRYWRLVRWFVGVVMRAALVTIKDLAEQGDHEPAAGG